MTRTTKQSAKRDFVTALWTNPLAARLLYVIVALFVVAATFTPVLWLAASI